jgi:putative ABC transport system substrate-binding protein
MTAVNGQRTHVGGSFRAGGLRCCTLLSRQLLSACVNPKSPELSESQSQELEVAARRLGLQLYVLNASTESEIDTAFATLVQLRAGGLVIGADALFSSRAEQLAALALRHRIPAIYQFPEFTAAAGS